MQRNLRVGLTLLSLLSVISQTQGQKLRRRTNADAPDGMEEVVISIDEGFSVGNEGGAFFAPPTFGVEKEGRIPVATAAGTVIAAALVDSSNAVSALWQGEEQDKRAAIEWDVNTADTPRGFSWPRCHWHAKYAINYTAFGLIDPNAVYWGQLVRGSGANIAYKMKGHFPKTVYFSWQVYAAQQSADPDQKITDVDVKPLWGKNPFADASTTFDETGGYEVYLTPTGQEGYPNELRLPNASINQLILRMYKPDPSLGPSTSIIDIEPPTLYMAHDAGEGKREWKALPRCSQHQEKVLADLSNAFYELQYPRGSGTEGYGVIPVLRDMNCPMNPKDGNVSFVLFQGSWLNPRLAIARQSIDSPYMMYCINPYNDWTYYLNTMLKVRFKLPTLADGLFSGTKVAHIGDYEVRYLSMSTADGFFPTIASVDGKGMQRFFNHTASSHGTSWDGWVEIRAALNEQKARDCGFWSDDAMFLPFESNEVHPAKSIVMFLRSILAKGPNSAGAAAKACNKGPLCGSPPFLRSVMQEQYPELEVYHCDSCVGKPPVVTRYADYFKHH